MSGRRVVVTGASGMVGYHVAQHLAACGWQVTAVVRATSNTAGLSALAATAAAGGGKIDIATAELLDGSALVKAMGGALAVVHAAGSVDPFGRRQEIFAVNVGGTGSCLEAAVEAGLKHFIQISSLSVITGQGDQFGLKDDAPLRYCGESYADSKVDAEKLVMSEKSGQRIQVTALRPGFIYGPQERAWMPRLINSLSTGKAMLVDGGNKETNVISVENLCRAVELALCNPAAYGQVYNLTDGQPVTKKDLFDAICDGMGMARITRTIPGPVAKLVCEIVSTVAPYLPVDTQRKLGRYSRAAFRLAGVNQGFDISKAERELGYTDRLPFSEGMRLALLEFKAAAAQSRPVTVREREANTV